MKIKEQISNLKELIEYCKQNYPKNYLYNTEKITYNQAYKQVNNLGEALLEKGLKDQNIAIMSENRYEWEITFLAISCGVGTVVPLDKTLSKKETKTILTRANISTIFCSQKYENTLKEIPTLKNIFVFEKDFENLISQEKPNSSYTKIKLDNNKTNFLYFTSGTTSKSKAVMLSHKNIVSNVISTNKTFQITPSDNALVVLPSHHVFEGIFGILTTLYSGASRTFCNSTNDIIYYLNNYDITYMGCVPSIYERLYKKIDEIDTNKIKFFLSAGAKLNIETEQKYQEKGIHLFQAYGMTETSPVISISNTQNHKIGSCGKIIDQVTVKTDPQNHEEILVKGPNIFKGYFKDETQTQDALKDGWFHTGDLGYIDNEGYLYITGRIKTMIALPNGKKVFPEELEDQINLIKNVEESLIFEEQLSNEKTGISAKIAIKSEENQNEIKKEIESLNNNLPKYKKITNIYFTNKNLKRTETGKLLRAQEATKIKATK